MDPLDPRRRGPPQRTFARRTPLLVVLHILVTWTGRVIGDDDAGKVPGWACRPPMIIIVETRHLSAVFGVHAVLVDVRMEQLGPDDRSSTCCDFGAADTAPRPITVEPQQRLNRCLQVRTLL